MPHSATRLWRAPRWALAVLLAALGTLGPFSIDTYLPAFEGIARALGATPVQMQQTLSAYLLGFAVMNLFHGTLADSFGRRPVVLVGIAVFTLASIGAALAGHIGLLIACRALQGMAAGTGMVVSRAVIRDLFPPAEAQRVMSQVTIFFGVAPAVAPIIGGWLFVHAGWQAVFWVLAGVGALLWLTAWRALPETLAPAHRQSFDLPNLVRGYVLLGSDRRFWLLALASGVPFNGLFLYVLSTPVFLTEHLGLGPTQFGWFFVTNIAGIMAGAWASGRLAGRMPAARQVRLGFAVTTLASLANVAGNWAWPAALPWAFVPLTAYAFGWALLVPVVTLMVLDLCPERRGLASSLQASVGSVANALVAGVLVPLVVHDTRQLALASALLMGIGLVAWHRVRAQVPLPPH